MTRTEWLAAVNKAADKLALLISSYHPSGSKAGKSMPITAGPAEAACAQFRHEIEKEKPEDPLARFDRARSSGDVEELVQILDECWFGVPESTSCWQIPGFAEAVALLEDVPEE